MKKLAATLAGATLIAFPAWSQSSPGSAPGAASQDSTTEQSAKPAVGATEPEANEAAAPAAPKPAAEGNAPESGAEPAKPAADAPQGPSH